MGETSPSFTRELGHGPIRGATSHHKKVHIHVGEPSKSSVNDSSTTYLVIFTCYGWLDRVSPLSRGGGATLLSSLLALVWQKGNARLREVSRKRTNTAGVL